MNPNPWADNTKDELIEMLEQQAENLESVQRALELERKEKEKWYNKFVYAEGRRVEMEEFGRAQARDDLVKRVQLQYTEVKGRLPILWVNSPDPRVINHGTYAQMRNILGRLCPKIEMLIMTYGAVRLGELTEEDLNQVGLARIADHAGGVVVAKTKTLPDHSDVVDVTAYSVGPNEKPRAPGDDTRG